MLGFDQIKADLGEKGITSEQVENLRLRYGKNELTPPQRDPVWKQYLRKYDDPIIKILVIAIIISVIVSIVEKSGLYETIGIILAVLLATSISFIMEYRSSKEFDILYAQREATGIKVYRDRSMNLIPLRDVVVGDLVFLEAGDLVPADGYTLDPFDLVIDESSFTGESESVQKEHGDITLKGTYVTCGNGHLLVGAVGDNTEMGKIAASLSVEKTIPTPLELKLEKLAGLISYFGYIMAILIVVSLFIRGIYLGEITGFSLQTANVILQYFMVAVVIIVVAVPEGLPMSVALSLSLAMRKMTRAHSLVRGIIACETIGSVTTICTDKTGTLTMNQMEVVETSIEEPRFFSGGIPEGPEEWIALNAAVNSTAHIQERSQQALIIGNTTEGALLKWLQQNHIDYLKLRDKFPPFSLICFDGKRKRMSTLVEIGDRKFLLVKGAPDVIASLCRESVDLSPVAVLSSRAMRTLAFAHKEFTHKEVIDSDESESDLIWDGYVGIRDRIREDVPAAIESCKNAGIKVRMVTGDSSETAKAIAVETGILTSGTFITGSKFRELPAEGRTTIASSIEVIARAEPMDKLFLVEALQKNGHVVGVTGDGTNDAPALKHADVGLAMGISGTEVAREASNIILLDDSFPTIVNAVWWGRALYENIQRFLIFQLTINFSACFIVFLAPLLGYPPPFTIIQLLWINIIMDSLAAFALCSENPHPDLMKRKPIQRDAPIITPYMWRAIIITALFYIIVGLMVIQMGFLGGSNPGKQSTLFFSAFVLAQVWNGINCRAINGIMPPFFKGNPIFFGVMSLIVVTQICLVQFGGVYMGTVPLSADEWISIAILSASVLVVGWLIRNIPNNDWGTHPSGGSSQNVKESST